VPASKQAVSRLKCTYIGLLSADAWSLSSYRLRRPSTLAHNTVDSATKYRPGSEITVTYRQPRSRVSERTSERDRHQQQRHTDSGKSLSM